MNIWILKYGKLGFSTHYVDEAKNLATTIEQLKFSDISQKQLGNFHFISITFLTFPLTIKLSLTNIYHGENLRNK